MDLHKVLKVAVRGGASDVILKVGCPPQFRSGGGLVPLREATTITTEVMAAWAQQVLPASMRQRLQSEGDADFSYTIDGLQRFRVNLFRQRQSYAMVLRVVSQTVRTLEELQLPSILGKLTSEKRGLILVTGATGSGKSTTLAAMVQKINLERAAHIITVEDPIEIMFKDARSTIQQREIGVDTSSFARSLRAALRQNPDVILVGELRDKETTETALMAAETGHLVLSTMHTIDACESLTRILSYFEPHQHPSLRLMLAETLKATVAQRLVRRKDGGGMVAAIEVMVCNGVIREAIAKAEDFGCVRDAIATGQESYGMQSFDQALTQLVQRGLITQQEALVHASNRADMERQAAGFGTDLGTTPPNGSEPGATNDTPTEVAPSLLDTAIVFEIARPYQASSSGEDGGTDEGDAKKQKERRGPIVPLPPPLKKTSGD